MEKVFARHISRLAVLLTVLVVTAFVVPERAGAQYYEPQLTPPPPSAIPPAAPGDSVPLPMPIFPTVPQSYDDLMRDELAYDLSTPHRNYF